MIQFDMPKEHSSIIKVIGVGGGGGNAVNHMFNLGMEGVDFVICNTDAQALQASRVPNKIQLGPNLTQGLGAGMNPSIGRQATEESLDEIRRLLEVNTKMVFITAGMGGGTGTGGAPVVARMCREMGILTVGIVTMPFSYEMKKRMSQAEDGIEEMKRYVDTLLVISNDKLRHQFGTLTFKAAFSTADNVLATATRCITEVISNRGHINVDFADVYTVMRNGGMAILGSARAEGEDRALRAIEQAIHSPLLNDNDIHGAKWVLININSSEGEHEFTVDEVEIIQQYLQSHAGDEYDLFMGLGYDSSLGAQIGITIIATGFDGISPDHAVTEADDRPAVATGEEPPLILQLGDAVENPTFDAAGPSDAPTVPDVADLMPTLVQLAPLSDKLGNLVRQPGGQESDAHRKFTNAPASIPLQITDTFQPGNVEGPHPPNHQTEGASTATDRILPLFGDFLAKPARIYAERDDAANAPGPHPLQVPHQEGIKEFDPNSEMHLVIRENPPADGPHTVSAATDSASIEEPAMQDEVEEQKRIKALRESKLRNLSYWKNTASDPKHELEQIPAFIRRGSPDKGGLPSAPEQLYSQVTLKADEERDRIYLSSLNSFLEGKKPD
ncbi:MAG: cell division protein FtsZ [Chitinophagia bacterium]|nr:cell division protein FtsZ [Chitinophagia bacterium]